MAPCVPTRLPSCASIVACEVDTPHHSARHQLESTGHRCVASRDASARTFHTQYGTPHRDADLKRSLVLKGCTPKLSSSVARGVARGAGSGFGERKCESCVVCSVCMVELARSGLAA